MNELIDLLQWLLAITGGYMLLTAIANVIEARRVARITKRINRWW